VAVWLLLRDGARPATTPEGPEAQVTAAKHVPVIDAGHGGPDGGANSVTGVREAEINLQIAVKTDLIMRFYGIPSVMTRTEDISLHDPGATNKKASDLKNRVALVEKTTNAVLISIHQNTYSDPNQTGMQVFYGKAHGSKDLAVLIQGTQMEALAPNNKRIATAVSGNVYLMNNVTCPAVLVECGFITNAAEEKRLRDDEYQKKLASVLAASFLNWETAGQGNELTIGN